MSKVRPYMSVGTALLLLTLEGCGTYVPSVAEFYDQPDGILDASGVLEDKIKQQVYCELKQAVVRATDTTGPEPRVKVYRHNKEVPALPLDWGVQVTLNLQVDETGAASPSTTWIGPLQHAQSFSLGGGATLSSQATRIDKFQSFYMISLLSKKIDPENDRCTNLRNRGSSFLLESNLGIDQWLQNALTVENDYISTPLTPNTDTAFKQDILSYEVKFIAITSGNLTPSLKLVRLTANQGSAPFLSANRTRTHDLLITFGPSQKPAKKGQPATPSAAITTADLASQIGFYVGANIRTALPSLPLVP